MADFAWGLEERGHRLKIVTSDAQYLHQSHSDIKLRANIHRRLKLKGDFKNGVNHLNNSAERRAYDEQNIKFLSNCFDRESYDGVLLGNLDLLGPELLTSLDGRRIPILHHIGYVSPPFGPGYYPKSSQYQMVAASKAVRQELRKCGIHQEAIPVVYPGARFDIFANSNGRKLPAPLGTEEAGKFNQLGSKNNPIKICFAGLIMSTKGLHTIVESLPILKAKGIHIELNIAGKEFQPSYSNAIREFLNEHVLSEHVQWYGQLTRPQLARFFRLNHIAIFPSIHPEAFGIVGTEAMASGLILITSGAGGAHEIIEDKISGMCFKPGNARDLAKTIEQLMSFTPEKMRMMAKLGQQRIKEKFSIEEAAKQLEQIFQSASITCSNKPLKRGHIIF